MNRILTYIVPSEEDQCKAEYFLKRRGFSHHLLTGIRQLDYGLMRDGKLLFTTERLSAGDHITVSIPDVKPSPNIVPRYLPFPIVYEDEDLLVIDKPADMPIHPSQGNFENTLANAAAYYFLSKKESFVYRVINRLDRNTTGLLIIAKNPLSGCILSNQVKNRKIHREYLAITSGILPATGIIDAPIGRTLGSTVVRTVDFQSGKHAVTHFQRLGIYGNCSLASIHLETGRTHQIRVHFQYIGHPLLGDFLYNPEDSRIKRQALHSYKLSFLHPITKKKLFFKSPIPTDMKDCILSLECFQN